MILDEILLTKQLEVAERRTRLSLPDLKGRIEGLPPTRDFTAALRRSEQSERRMALARGLEPEGKAPTPALIAEIKAKSPSKGVILADFDPLYIARSYWLGGARCLSVLTDEQYFGGELERIALVKQAVDLPVLQKDFIIDPYQIYEARSIGADCILLIVAALEEQELVDLYGLARELGLHVLVETHTRQEIVQAVMMGAEIIGINNRNLQTFEVSLETTEALASTVPAGRVLVGESGIFTRADAERLAAVGVDAILVGEALMVSGNIEEKTRELTG